MKQKGFDKPIKYIFIGDANTTKTSLAHRAGLKVFETDGLTEEQALDFKFYPQNTDVIIVGGKWTKHQTEIVAMLSKELKEKYQLIQVRFSASSYDTLKFFIQSAGTDGYMVFISTPDRILQVHLDPEDGYRSRADVVPDEEVDGLKFWLDMEGGKKKVFQTECEQILIGFEEQNQNYELRGVIIRAKLHGKTVFEVGTDNSDDYYPRYYLTFQGKELEDILKEAGIDEA
jgi:hypothetical protein